VRPNVAFHKGRRRVERDEHPRPGSTWRGRARRRVDHLGAIRGLIQTRRHLGPWKKELMQDPSLLMEAFVELSRTPTEPNPQVCAPSLLLTQVAPRA
jgi:hypothetical protein